MNEPVGAHPTDRLTIDLDRLVDGELAQGARRALLLRLEAEPDGWRRCALAFLQSQCWRQAVEPLAAAAAAQAVAAKPTKVRSVSRWRGVARTCGLAAGLAMAFSLGWIVRPNSATSSAQVADANEALPKRDRPDESFRSEPQLQAGVDPAPIHSNPAIAGIRPVVTQWEQHGYRAETQTRRASLKLLDGRKVEVPLHEVRLKYVRDRTY